MKLKTILYMTFILLLSGLLSACSDDQKKIAETANISEAEMQVGRALLVDNCSGCHVAADDGSFSRISQIRKTPEGWDMNIARMMIFHGLDIDAKDRRSLVKFLADTQGLAPSETVAHRDVLERKHNIIEQGADPDLMAMCARCHTYARVALQRRDKAEWQNLVHMHLGQWASIEYQMLARERDWRADALGPVSEQLGQMYPLKTPSWDEWQATKWQDMSGEWRMIGHLPGMGYMDGIMKVMAVGGDRYDVTYDLIYPDGTAATGTGKSIVHSGYEWRGAATLGDQKYHQIWAASEGGNVMTGRFFKRDHPEDGMIITAWRKTDNTHAIIKQGIMNIVPSALKIGQETEIVISGVNLSGDVSIAGAAVTLKSAGPDRIVISAIAEMAGSVMLAVGEDNAVMNIYTQVDYIKVTPDYGISRVGGGGGPIPKVMAQFEATGYSNGPDGLANTDDDIPLGMVPAVWSVENYSAGAAAMQDAKYAGHITAEGTFIPAVAGPNTARKYGTNNVGDLKVIATYRDAERILTAEAHLIATVQRWNNPPIM